MAFGDDDAAAVDRAGSMGPPSVPTIKVDSQEASFPMMGGPQRAATTGGKQRKKVILEPGHSQVDWIRLKNSGADLRGVTSLGHYTLEQIAKHNKKDDYWCALYGKVYNLTAYLKFHPGGVDELMRCAGRDATRLFISTHAWVNYGFLLDHCLVGFLAPSSDSDSDSDSS